MRFPTTHTVFEEVHTPRTVARRRARPAVRLLETMHGRVVCG
jgi:hypothetical protein